MKNPLSLEEQKHGRVFADTFIYKNHSHENLLNSLENNIEHHVIQFDKYDFRGGISVFLAFYEEIVLSYTDNLGNEKWYNISGDNHALLIIKRLLESKIDYFVLYNSENIHRNIQLVLNNIDYFL